MYGVARVNDIGIGVCTAHVPPVPVVVTLVSGATTVLTNNLSTATSISIGTSSCGHTSTVITYSTTVMAEGGGVHRLNDTGSLPGGTYTVSVSSVDTFAGG